MKHYGFVAPVICAKVIQKQNQKLEIKLISLSYTCYSKTMIFFHDYFRTQINTCIRLSMKQQSVRLTDKLYDKYCAININVLTNHSMPYVF